MKRILLGLLPMLLLGQSAPDISRTYTFSGATPGAAVSAEAQPAVAWRLTYYANSASAFSALSIQLEGAPDVNGSPPPPTDASWVLMAATPTQGTNPLTNTSQGTLALQAYYPWVRVNITTLTGTGTVKAQLLGYKGTTTASGSGGGSGSGVSYCAPAGGNATAYTCAPNPALTSYTAGVTLAFVPDVTGSGGPTTVKPNALATKSVKLADGSTDPGPNDLLAGEQYYLLYDGTVFRIGPHEYNPMTTLGDMIYGDTGGAPARVAGNPTIVPKVLTQTGDGTNSAAPVWALPPLSGFFLYYFTDTASDIAGDLQATSVTYSPKTTLGPLALVNGTVTLKTFATNANNPGQNIPAGVYLVHIHASRSSAPISTVYLQAVIQEVSATGVFIATIGTTEQSAAINPQGGEQEFDIAFADTDPYILASPTSRIAVLVQAICGSATPTATLYVGETADAHISFPSNGATINNLVPYTGATGPVDLGTNTFIALGTPRCQMFTTPYTNAAFQAASTAVSVTLLALPAKSKILGITIQHTTPFAGTAVTATTESVGDGTGTFDQYASAFNIFQAASATVFQDSSQFKSTTMAGSNVVAHFIANTNFGTGAATVLTAGSVDTDVCWVPLP